MTVMACVRPRYRFKTLRVDQGLHLCRLYFPICGLMVVGILTIQSAYAMAGHQTIVSLKNFTAPILWPQGFPRMVTHTFKYVAPADRPLPQTISVVGDFNFWSNTATPMRQISRGVWITTVKLTPGLHHYRFSLNEHGNAAFSASWIVDPAADPNLQSLPNAFGRVSSGVRIPWPWQHKTSAPPNYIPVNAMAYNPMSWRYCDVISPHLLRFELITQKGGLSCAMVYVEQNHGHWRKFSLLRQGLAVGASRWSIVVRVPGPVPEVHYYFSLSHGTQRRYLAYGHFWKHWRQAARHAYICNMRASVVTPNWAKRAIWYQIWVGRFRDGSPADNQPNTVPWRWPWYKPYHHRRGKFNAAQRNFNRDYGGDIQGVQQELPYLRKLGINALYFNPIFEAPGVVKYAPQNYVHVDDGYAIKGSRKLLHGEKVGNPATWQWSKSDLLFLHFLSVAHRQGFKVILDVPFHHCGSNFDPFQNVLKFGLKSPYAKWFRIKNWGPPVQYTGLGGTNNTVPVFAHYPKTGLATGLCRYFLAVTRRWLAPNGNPVDGIDGWRMDMASSIPHPFWIAWRKVLNDVKPDALAIGEQWTSAQAWLNRGNQWDGQENYPFANAAMYFFVDHRGAGEPGIGPHRFAQVLQGLLNRYPYQVDLVQLNLLDSQDPCRFVSRFMYPDRTYWPPSKKIGEPPSAKAYQRLRQVVALQVAFPGAPMFLYGDEVGMYSAAGYPLNCRPMVWKDLLPYDNPHVKIHTHLLNFYRRAIATRRQLSPLQIGDYGELLADKRRNIFAFHRDLDNQHVYVIFNRSAVVQRVQVPIFASDEGHHLFNYLSRRQMALVFPPVGDITGRPILRRRKSVHGYLVKGRHVTIQLPPWGSAILAR